MPFVFDPPDGYRNIARFPTTPASEEDFRSAMQSLLDQLRDEMNNGVTSAIGIHAMSRQAIINGNFDVWQRGTSFTNLLSNVYLADRFMVAYVNSGVLPNITHNRVKLLPGEVPGSFYCHQLVTDGAGNGFAAGDNYNIQQRIEHGTRFLAGLGKKVTVSFMAKSDIPNKQIGLRLIQNYGSGGAPSAPETVNGKVFTLTADWKRYTATFDTNTLAGKTFGINNDDFLMFAFGYMWGSAKAAEYGDVVAETFVAAGNSYITQIQVNAGNEALPFQPRSYADELHLCRRYFRQRSTNNVNQYDLSPEMRISPTITGNASPYNYDAEL